MRVQTDSSSPPVTIPCGEGPCRCVGTAPSRRHPALVGSHLLLDAHCDVDTLPAMRDPDFLIAGLKARDGDRRKDWVEKNTAGLARRFDVIRVENLNVKAMTATARGTMQHPGRKVQGRPEPGHPQVRLRSARNPVGAEGAGRVEEVKADCTSQTCHPSQHIAAQSHKSQAGFVYVACGRAANADVNAARNIAAGHGAQAHGDRAVLARPVKREPQHGWPAKAA